MEVTNLTTTKIIPLPLFERHKEIKLNQLQAWSGPEGSSKLRFPDFMTTARTSPACESVSGSLTREPGLDIFHHTRMSGFPNFARTFQYPE